VVRRAAAALHCPVVTNYRAAAAGKMRSEGQRIVNDIKSERDMSVHPQNILFFPLINVGFFFSCLQHVCGEVRGTSTAGRCAQAGLGSSTREQRSPVACSIHPRAFREAIG
jgi:hypothetical protein